MSQPQSDWDQSPKPAAEALTLRIDGYEGPLDLLLDLARRQRVDLGAISVRALADQYLRFIAELAGARIEIAADYLVMAAWLTYLKSRLLLPAPPADEHEPSPVDMAAVLQHRLARLDAMRAAARALTGRPRLGVDVFARGGWTPAPASQTDPSSGASRHLLPQGEKEKALVPASGPAPRYEASLYELLRAYATQRERGVEVHYQPAPRDVMALAEAREILGRLIGGSGQWLSLERYLVRHLGDPKRRASVLASGFASSLELVREGKIELRQSWAFGPLLARGKPPREDA